MISTGNPRGTVSEAKGQQIKSHDEIPDSNGDESYFIENNLPYITTLEYGLFPNPVKKGSRVKGKNGKSSYVKKSQNGFSKQAPQGMVGLAMAEFSSVASKTYKDEGVTE